jgi:formylglycine-generating enzyme required for sulfatase activity
MKKAFVLVWIVMISLVVIANTGAKIEMRNGDVIECEINMENISFITDYGELKIPVSFVREIVFPAPGNRVTTLNTVFPNETFGGFLLDEYISISLLGAQTRLHKDAISRIVTECNIRIVTDKCANVLLKTGDTFLGKVLSETVTVQTSYGEFPIKLGDISWMEFEGDGNVLTTVALHNSSQLKGIIKDDYIALKLLIGSEANISLGKLNRVTFGPVEVFVNNTLLIRSDSFVLGDTRDEGFSNEKPLSDVSLTYDYYIGRYEVTFDEYDLFCSSTCSDRPGDGSLGRGSLPVVNVTWWDAIKYCNWLSERYGLPLAYSETGGFLDGEGKLTKNITNVVGFRLPTEAEWEYAARGGSGANIDYMFSGSDQVNEVAWYLENSQDIPHEVGKKSPNRFGLYDMSGNVWEWCSDFYGRYSKETKVNPSVLEGSSKVIRGGSFADPESYVRISVRESESPDSKFGNIGFRICRTAFQ